MGMVLEPEPPKTEDPVIPNTSLASAGVDLAEKKKRDEEAAKNAPVVPAVPAPAAPEPAPAAAPVAPAAQKPVVRKIPTPAPAPAPVVPPVVQDDPKKAEDEYVKGLSLEQQDELAVAVYAEKEGKPGLRAKLIDSYKKFDEYLRNNPDADPAGEEAQKIVAQNRPAWSQGEFRRAERAMIRDEATTQAEAKVRKEMEPAVQDQQRQLRAIQSKPRIDAAVTQVADQIVKEASDVVDPQLLKVMREQGPKAALEQFPFETPIIQSHMDAARAWRELREGVQQMSEQNPLHAWLLQFVNQESHNMKGQPAEAQTLKDGRTFVTLHEWAKLSEADKARHWTYDDPAPDAVSVTDLIGASAALSIKSEHARLVKAGFKRDKPVPVSTQPGTPPPSAQPATPPSPVPPPVASGGSPRAGQSVVPAGADNGTQLSESLKAMELIFPGSSKIIAGQ